MLVFEVSRSSEQLAARRHIPGSVNMIAYHFFTLSRVADHSAIP